MDPATFFLSLGPIAVAAAIVFGFTEPGSNKPETIHRAAIIHSVVAVVLAIPGSWLGFPVVVAGGGIALGLRALDGPHRRVAMTAIVLGALVKLFGVLSTAFPPADND